MTTRCSPEIEFYERFQIFAQCSLARASLWLLLNIVGARPTCVYASFEPVRLSQPWLDSRARLTLLSLKFKINKLHPSSSFSWLVLLLPFLIAIRDLELKSMLCALFTFIHSDSQDLLWEGINGKKNISFISFISRLKNSVSFFPSIRMNVIFFNIYRACFWRFCMKLIIIISKDVACFSSAHPRKSLELAWKEMFTLCFGTDEIRIWRLWMCLLQGVDSADKLLLG